MRKIFYSLILTAFSTVMFAQGSISGTVSDGDTGEALIGASVSVKGTSLGTVTDINGMFKIMDVPTGDQVIVISYVGFESNESAITVSSGNNDLGGLTLNSGAYLSEIEVVADYAVARKTPVAFVNLDKKKIEKVLGSRDIPLMLNTTPSVYATEQGGGAGDARINVRGFNQRNVAIMINGVPVNDMENGWVYWSNWDGVADAASSIQLQRGLSAVNLATPSIGGTMNILTSPADKEAGGVAKFEYGSGNFLKSTITGHSGLIKDKFAMSASVVRKVGDGIIDATWTDAWAYYLGTSYKINDDHKLEFFALGAPQRHGQNLYKQNIAVYDHEYAESIDYDTSAFSKYQERGREFNQNWAEVNSSYDGDQGRDDKTFERHSKDFINERENFYHKPQVNLNWYADWTDKVSQSTVLYYSGGQGGGTGTYGRYYQRDANGELGDDDYKYYYGQSPWSIDWDQTIAMNASAADTFYINKSEYVKEDGQSIGILRNSRNNQNTVGVISKLNVKWNKDLKSTFGVDWRTAKIEHYREVRDLLGGTFYKSSSDQFNPNQNVGLGDRIDYNTTNTVDWLGGFFQTEYSKNALTAYVTLGYSTIKYSHLNHFEMDPDNNADELSIQSDWVAGLQAKGGLGYKVLDNLLVFGNAGYVSKVPILDAVVNDNTSELIEDYENEEFVSGEIGAKFWTNDGKLTFNLNLYHTTWSNRTITVSDYDFNTSNEGLLVLRGLDALHQGIEMDLAYAPIDLLRFDVAASFGNWKNTADADATHHDYTTSTSTDYPIYTKDLKIGDAPQNQFAISGTVFPVEGLSASLIYKYYSKFYADWNATTRRDENDRAQSWEAPAYSLFDLHAAYTLPLKGRLGVDVFAHVFNLTDAIYIQDAVDNSKYNGYTIKDDDGNDINSHSAERAEVFLGLPRRFNAGVKLTF